MPDTLRYGRYRAFWEAFLPEVGADVLRPELPKADALAAGADLMPGEPPTVQLFLGRVLELAPLVDALLVPDLNPGADPEAAGDPWAADLPAVLARRLSLPTLWPVPARLDADEVPGLAARYGQAVARNPQLVRRALDRTQAQLRRAREGEPRWSLVGRATVGVVGEPALLEEPALWPDLPPALDAARLHPVLATELPRDRAVEHGRRARPELGLESDLEAAGGAQLLESRPGVRGLVVLTEPRANHANRVLREVASRSRRPAVVVEAGSRGLAETVLAFGRKLAGGDAGAPF